LGRACVGFAFLMGQMLAAVKNLDKAGVLRLEFFFGLAAQEPIIGHLALDIQVRLNHVPPALAALNAGYDNGLNVRRRAHNS
jgi:hypothetical protein